MTTDCFVAMSKCENNNKTRATAAVAAVCCVVLLYCFSAAAGILIFQSAIEHHGSSLKCESFVLSRELCIYTYMGLKRKHRGLRDTRQYGWHLVRVSFSFGWDTDSHRSGLVY